jgi:hypothetical protein
MTIVAKSMKPPYSAGISCGRIRKKVEKKAAVERRGL